MVDRYWRKIEDVRNDIENSMQISSILLKLKGYDEKLGDLSKIGNNESNISSNLGKIDTNRNNISSNLGKIDTNKNTISSNLGIIDRGIFFEKVFDVNASINDFIEMNFKIDLEYEHISERNYFKTIYEIFDETNNTLYVKSVTNDDYTYFSNRVIIDENIFYNFTEDNKKIKFVIEFQMILTRVIKIWYIKNENYRLVIKNYGL